MKKNCRVRISDGGLGWAGRRVGSQFAMGCLLARFLLRWLALPKPPLLDGISFSQVVRDRNGKLLRVTLSADQKFRIWTPLPKFRRHWSMRRFD